MEYLILLEAEEITADQVPFHHHAPQHSIDPSPGLL